MRLSISALHLCSTKSHLLIVAALHNMFESANQNREKHIYDDNGVYFQLTWTMFSWNTR